MGRGRSHAGAIGVANFDALGASRPRRLPPVVIDGQVRAESEQALLTHGHEPALQNLCAELHAACQSPGNPDAARALAVSAVQAAMLVCEQAAREDRALLAKALDGAPPTRGNQTDEEVAERYAVLMLNMAERPGQRWPTSEQAVHVGRRACAYANAIELARAIGDRHAAYVRAQTGTSADAGDSEKLRRALPEWADRAVNDTRNTGDGPSFDLRALAAAMDC